MERLPVEIRLQIWKNIVPSGQRLYIRSCYTDPHSTFVDTSYYDKNEDNEDDVLVNENDKKIIKCQRSARFPTRLMTVSKMVAQECSGILYGTNTFKLTGLKDLSLFLDAVPKHYRCQIKHLSLSDTCTWSYARGALRHHIRYLVRNVVLSFPNLDVLHLVGVGKGIRKKHYLGLKLFDFTKWLNADFNILFRLTHAPTSLKDGVVYCDHTRRNTTICRAGYRYTPAANECLVDITDEGQKSEWRLEPELGQDYQWEYDPLFCSDDCDNTCQRYWCHTDWPKQQPNSVVNHDTGMVVGTQRFWDWLISIIRRPLT